MDVTTQKNWILRFVKGIVIALGFILPGISGATLAAILGLYERILNFLAHVTTDFKKNFLFFLPVGLGGIIGIVVLSRPLGFLVEHYLMVVLWGFAGAIIGTVPALFKESVRERKRDSIDTVLLFISLIGGFLFLYFMGDIFGTVPANFVGFIIAGALLAFSVLIPGISSANLLIILGLYAPMLEGFRNVDIVGVFLPMAIGGCALVLLFSKVMDRLISNHHTRTYHCILGIVLASVILIVIPPVMDYSEATVLKVIVSGVCFVAGILLGVWMSRLEEKYK